MKFIKTNKTLLIILLTISVISCNNDAVVENSVKEHKMKIVSPVNGANYAKHEEIKFEAYLLLENDTVNYDNIEWDLDNDGVIVQAGEFNWALNIGKHQIICTISEENKIYADSVLIEVENRVIVDTLSYNNQIALFSIPGNIISCLNVDKNDNVILGTEDTGLYIKNEDSWNNYDNDNGLNWHIILNITLNHAKEIYVTYLFNNGISKLTENGWENIEVNPSIYIYNGIYSMAFDKDNNLWGASGDGTVINYIDDKWNTLNTWPEQDVNFHHPSGLEFDSKNVLWGSSNYGAIKYDGQNWDSVFVDGEILRSFCIAIDDEDNIWYGAYEGLYKISDTDTLFYNTANSGIPSNTVWTLAFDSNNTLWMGTNGGLVKFDGVNWELIHLPVNEKVIRNLAIDSKDVVWFSISSLERQSFAFGFYNNNN